MHNVSVSGRKINLSIHYLRNLIKLECVLLFKHDFLFLFFWKGINSTLSKCICNPGFGGDGVTYCDACGNQNPMVLEKMAGGQLIDPFNWVTIALIKFHYETMIYPENQTDGTGTKVSLTYFCNGFLIDRCLNLSSQQSWIIEKLIFFFSKRAHSNCGALHLQEQSLLALWCRCIAAERDQDRVQREISLIWIALHSLFGLALLLGDTAKSTVY